MVSVAEVSRQIAVAEDKVKLADAVSRLKTNRDFITVFSNHIFKDKILDLVNEIHMYPSDSVEHTGTVKQLEAISTIQSYLDELIDKGQSAQREISSAMSIPDSELD